MRRLLIAIIMLAVAGAVAVPAQAETFRFTAAARCPYACPDLPGQGPMVQALREAFAAAGTGIDIEFLPWQRAVATARHDQAFAGYLVDDGSVEAGFTLSPPLMSGTLGLAVRRGSEQGDVSTAGLRGLSLLVLAGHAITPAIDGAIVGHRLSAYAVDDDATMLRMLAAGRMDAAVIDADVFAWLQRHAPDLALVRDTITFNPAVLGAKTRHVAFAGNELGRRAAMAFAAGNALQDAQAPVRLSHVVSADAVGRLR